MRWKVLLAAVVAIGTLATAGSAMADSLSVSCGGEACNESGGWYTTAVPLTWTVSPAPTQVQGCLSTTYVAVTTVVSCHVWWGANGTPPDQEISFPLNVDGNPTVTYTVSRSPDSRGWYTHPATVMFSGSSFSGIVSCSAPATYSGRAITGSCTDNAGRVASTTVSLNYDPTLPTITGATASHPPNYNGWYTKPVTFTFNGTDAISGIESCQTVRYTSTISGWLTGGCWDNAGNYNATRVWVRRLPVIGRAAARVASSPLLLRWRPTRHASYYNVQLYRGSHKLLSRWPSSSTLFLAWSWRFDGRTFRLKPGRYHWYVWPGYGHRASDRYGRMIMSATFTVT